MENSNNEVKSKKTKWITLAISAIGSLFMIWYLWGGGIERNVAYDEIKQYEMCARNGDHIGASVHAGVISAAFSEAGDEENYKKWRVIEEQEMQKANKAEEKAINEETQNIE